MFPNILRLRSFKMLVQMPLSFYEPCQAKDQPSETLRPLEELQTQKQTKQGFKC